MISMDPTLVSRFFVQDSRQPGALYRLRADGSARLVKSKNGNRLFATFDHERVDAAAIVWCLKYGNWPKWPLAILDGDPENLELENLRPAKGRTIRYASNNNGTFWTHPLSRERFKSDYWCRRDWLECAKRHYAKDLEYCLQVEADERELRANAPPEVVDRFAAGRLDWERRQAASKAAKSSYLEKLRAQSKPPRPAEIPGRVWTYYKDAWINVPQAVHVSDDLRSRCAATLKGAIRFEYQPDVRQTWAFNAAGERVT